MCQCDAWPSILIDWLSFVTVMHDQLFYLIDSHVPAWLMINYFSWLTLMCQCDAWSTILLDLLSCVSVMHDQLIYLVDSHVPVWRMNNLFT